MGQRFSDELATSAAELRSGLVGARENEPGSAHLTVARAPNDRSFRDTFAINVSVV
jgi:hypothetical protein